MSDEEEQYNAKTHKNLLQAISSLGKVQHIRKATRNELKPQQDEFHLSKGAITAREKVKYPVGINDIVQVLKTTKKHIDAGKEFKNTLTTKKVLDKPLEKPAADRIKRTLGYENVKQKLERWDAIVATNRVAETQVFPLKSETIYVNTSAFARPLKRSLRSEMELEMMATDAKLRELIKERKGDFENEKDLQQREQELLKKKFTRDELIAKRKELAYLRIRESQKSAKARMHNKIKSKKFHKLLKRQKLQEQIKEFEMLQKTNPEAALEKLNELEKSRVMERANLRHKNTGAWAKNLQVRAKYDKDVRKDLAEQLQISRQLTQKENIDDDESDDDKHDAELIQKNNELNEEDQNDPFNPWTKISAAKKKNESTDNEMENWRKYWLERNENEEKLNQYKQTEKTNGENVEEEHMEEEKAIKAVAISTGKSKLAKSKEKQKVIQKKGKSKMTEANNNVELKTTEPLAVRTNTSKLAKIKENKVQKNIQEQSGWIVEDVEVEKKVLNKKPLNKQQKPAKIKKINKNIDDIFDEQEEHVRQKLDKKLKQMTKDVKRLKDFEKRKKKLKIKTKTNKDQLQNLKDLSFKTEAKRPIIDEELNADELDKETNKLNGVEEAKVDTITKLNKNDEVQAKKTSDQVNEPQIDTIDPQKFATVKLKQHLGAFSELNDVVADVDEVTVDDFEDDRIQREQQMTISQAFEDDDIIADFSRDKKQDAEIKNDELQLSMPGWGSWAGSGISAEQEQAYRNKRIILKLAKEEKRRDDNKNGLYINEDVSKQLRTHLVSDVPFPFKSLQAYEASIRAPIGRNFVTETSFRMLTRPAVITLKGKVIEPMDENELIKRKRPLRHVVDRRIERAATAKIKTKKNKLKC